MDGLIIILLFVVVTIARNMKKLAETAKRTSPKTPVGKQAPVQRFDTNPTGTAPKSIEHTQEQMRHPAQTSLPLDGKGGEAGDTYSWNRFGSSMGASSADSAYRPSSARPADDRPQDRKRMLPNFSANEMVRAVVMHEVLTRPAQRKQRRVGGR